MRVLVCGGRDYNDHDAVFGFLDNFCVDNGLRYECDEYGNWLPKDIVIIHGACPTGADSLADQWAVVNWVQFVEFRADWKTYGNKAGPIRNQRMIDEGKPDIVIGFPGGRGTADMLRRARAANIKVVEPK